MMTNKKDTEFSLLQSIKTKLGEEVSKDKGRQPNSDEVKKYFLALPSDRYFFRWFYYLWTIKIYYVIKVMREESVDIHLMLKFLEIHPVKQAMFYEIENSPTECDRLGVLIYAEPLINGGYVHVILILNDDFPKHLIKIYELNVTPGDKDPFLLEIDNERTTHSRTEFQELKIYNILYSVILAYYENQTGERYIPMSDIRENKFPSEKIKEKNAPPVDPKYDELIISALQNEVNCHRAVVDVKFVKLCDEEFVNAISASDLQDERKLQENRGVLGPVVYWSDLKQAFIVSDDYISFIALLLREINPIQVIVMGDFPQEKATIIESGFSELIPGIYLKEAHVAEEGSILRNRITEVNNLSEIEEKRQLFLDKYDEIWIGINQIAFGLLLAPEFKNGTWCNIDNRLPQTFIPWTIGHVLFTGLVIPNSNRKHKFDDVNSLLDFYVNVLVRQSQSSHQLNIADYYCQFVKRSKNPTQVPFLIPEFRYDGKLAKHKYRLDFAIINFTRLVTIGIELSPWSSHGKIIVREKSSKMITEAARANRNKEIEKTLAFFRAHGIHILTYSDEELNQSDLLFDDINRYLKLPNDPFS